VGGQPKSRLPPEIEQNLTDQERKQLRSDTTKRLIDAFHSLPDTHEYAAAALAGEAKKGWYRDSAKAIVNVFGPDAPRFAAALSAMSPQTSVQSNFHNAIRTFINWDKAGRPQNPARIKNIMRNSVQRQENGAGVLHAWVPNTIRALTHPDPEKLPVPNLEPGQGDTLSFRHFSKTAKGDKVMLDPSYYGSGVPGAEAKRIAAGAPKVIAAYGAAHPDSQVEHDVRQGATEYQVRVPRSQMYDLSADPDNIKGAVAAKDIRDGGSGVYNHSDAENMLKEKGYAGYYLPNGAGTMKDQARFFKPVEGVRAGSGEVPSDLQSKVAPQYDPSETVRGVAEQYMKKAGMPYERPEPTVIDTERSARIAKAYDAMKHNPSNPKVKASYAALAKETLAQYKAMQDAGVKVEFMPKGKDPYGDNPRAAVDDIRKNNHLYVYPTSEGFGTEGEAPSDHPLLKDSGIKFGGKAATVNDVFRAVHDYFGHAKEGNGFRATGEENAWRQHAAMYSAAARPAMTAETRGQNSWVNYGPHGESNRTAGQSTTKYAAQKAGLMPSEFSEPKIVSKSEGSALPGLQLSGPKVNSFMHNLTGNVNEVTNDAWMATFSKIDPAQLGGKGNKSGPGKSPTYLASNAKARQAASMLTHLTGEKWTPAEVQETVWSWAKTAFEHAARNGKKVSDVVKNGEITDDLIRSTPDFHNLFGSDEHAGFIADSRYAENAQRLAGGQKQSANPANASEKSKAAQEALRPHLERASERLGKALEKRRKSGDEAPF
jgi:hypothetical protein